MLPDRARVLVTRREAPGIVTHKIAWAGCAAGKFDMPGLPDHGGVPVSVSGSTAAIGRVIHTIRLPGSVSAVLAELVPRAALTIRGPHGRPWPLHPPRGRRPVVLGTREPTGLVSCGP
jgi:NAD(P)H-flavin reductase